MEVEGKGEGWSQECWSLAATLEFLDEWEWGTGVCVCGKKT